MEQKISKFRERYANDSKFRAYYKAKAKKATADLDDDGRKKRAEYMRNYRKKQMEKVIKDV